MRLIRVFVLALFLFPIKGVVFGQNIWVENATEQFGCTVKDSIRVQVFDPDSVISVDTIRFDFGDGTDLVLNIQEVGVKFDSTYGHEYPGCGSFIRSFSSEGILLLGQNVGSTTRPYYYDELVNFDLIRGYRRSPRFDLGYQITKCQSEDWFGNPFQSELDGDSLVFYLDTADSNVSVPSQAFVDPITGEMIWIGTSDTGVFQFIYRIKEYDGVLINYPLARHLARFTIRVTDSCKTLVGHDSLDGINLFEQQGRKFQLNVNETWEYSFCVAKSEWDSISIEPSSEILQSEFSAIYSITDIGDSIEYSIQWQTGVDNAREHPYLLTYHIVSYKGGKPKHHRILTNAVYVIDTSVGIDERDASSIFSVYPNPATDKLIVDYPSAEPLTVRILDLMGRTVQLSRVKNAVLDLQQLEAGTYLIRVETGREMHTTIVQKH